MTTNPDQTKAVKRLPGRPSKEETSPPSPVQLVYGRVPPIICPVCQRGMQPRADKSGIVNAKGEILCTCSLNGCRFAYLIPTVRPI